MRVYYAHCIALYGTPQEARDLLLLEMLGFEVVNPNDPDIDAQCARVRAEWPNRIAYTTDERLSDFRSSMTEYRDASAAVMNLVFKPLVSPQHVEAVAFRALPDGRIPSGVALEIEWAKQRGLPIFELPTFAYDRVMSVDTTRTYLREIGQR